MRILIAEDEKDLNRVIARKLREDGYLVDTAFDGGEALDYLRAAEYDMAVLDVMMPEMDGFALLAAMRAEGIRTPVIFLTARDAVEDRIRGLDLGGCDYMVKPFSLLELSARIRAGVRKSDGNPDSRYRLADLELDTATHEVTRAGRQIPLSAKEYAMLEYLLRNKGLVLSREKIENAVWGYDYEGGTNVVDVYIRYLRQKIDDGAPVRLIHTVRGSGYVLKEGGQ